MSKFTKLSKAEMKSVIGGGEVGDGSGGGNGCYYFCVCYHSNTTWSTYYADCQPSEIDMLDEFQSHCGNTQAGCYQPL